MTSALAERPASAATAHAVAFVAARKPLAEELGRELADRLSDPAAFVRALDRALRKLADPAYQEGSHAVVPGLGPTHGVRWPLLRAIQRGLEAATRDVPVSTLLDVAGALLREPVIEHRWMALGLLERTVRSEPERSWQLLRQAAAQATDWATVDTLAHPVGRGILAEPYRWAELEQLVYSPSSWERRLVPSTIATIPHIERGAGHGPIVVERGLALLEDLIGDAAPEVRKALSWAYRSLARIDHGATAAALRDEARIAAETGDGHRAWVIRDAASRLPDEVADELRTTLGTIRSRARAPATSRASAAAAGFLGIGLDTAPADRPVIPRP